jgi:hypothetical protein
MSVESRYKFKRLFLIFKQEDPGYGSGQEPSGYLKVEVRDGKGKLYAMVQNLREDKEISGYRLYLVKGSEKDISPVCVGVIPIHKNKGEIKWEFDPNDVIKSGNSIDDYKAAVILAESKDRNNTTISCPLAAYNDQKINWRSSMREYLHCPGTRETDTVDELIQKEDIFSKYTDNYESKYTPVEDATEFNIPVAFEGLSSSPESGMGKQETDRVAGEEDEGIAQAKDARPDMDYEPYKQSLPDDSIPDQDKGIGEENAGDTTEEAMHDESPSLAGNDGILNAQGSYVPVNPCMYCNVQGEKEENLRKSDGSVDIDKLMEYFNKNFEKSDPFQIRRRDYKWWKVNNPVYLNNLLYQFNIKTPLLFNPVVMMAHYKYKHLIAGIFTDFARGKEYVVAGIPALYGIEGKPFGDMCRWVQLDGSKLRYGAFGYWLVYIEPRTGKLLKFS